MLLLVRFGVTFSNLASFVMLLFDGKTVSVWPIHTGQPKIKDGDMGTAS